MTSDGATEQQHQKQEQNPQTQHSAPQPNQQPVVIARALYTFIGESSDELAFRKDDLLEIIGQLGQDWWYARRQRGLKVGFVPCNYVILQNPEIVSLSAWFETDRRGAEKLLLLPGIESGTYLLRPSSTGYYALSVRVSDAKKKNYYSVKHYKVTVQANGGYYVTPHITFSTMNDLLTHYHDHADGMWSRLTAPLQRDYKQPERLADIEVNRESIELQDKLGSGSFSDVHLARLGKTLPVAVKMTRPSEADSKRLELEAQLLLKLNHPNVLQILGVCTQGEPAYILTELMLNGALSDYLRRDGGILLRTEHLVDMMIQVADAMAYLEGLKVVHRDLRAANVLVSDANEAKVADFGLARQMDDTEVYVSNEHGKFPAKWTPVEAALKCRFSSKSDVWSFGVLMWEIVTYGGMPYSGLTNREVLDFVARGYRMPNPHGGPVYCDQNIYGTMLECWDASPELRPAFSRLRDSLGAYMAVFRAAAPL